MLIKKDAVGLILRTGFGFTKRLILKSKDTGLPLDLTGATGRLDIKLDPADPVPFFSFVTGAATGGLLTFSAVPGSIDFLATDEDTAALVLTVPVLRAVHNFKLTMPGGEARWLFGGPAIIYKWDTAP